MGSRMGFYLWQETKAGINPGLPGKDERQYWWTRWWGQRLLHKDLLSSYQDPSFFGQALASSTAEPLCGAGQPKRNKERNHVMERPGKGKRLHKATFAKFREKCSRSHLMWWFFCLFDFFSVSLPQTGVSGFDIGGFAVRPWNTTPDLTSLSTVKTRASCYFSSDYFISKSSTINHHPLLEKYNAYTQTEACNQSFTVTGTGGFQRVNRGEPNDTVVSKLRLCLENPMRYLYLCWAARKGDKANVVMITIVVLSLKHGVWLEPRFCFFDVYSELQTIP